MMPHMRHMFLDPVFFGNEMIYSLMVIVLCMMIFYLTRELYSLSTHKGIRFFRMTFFFLGLAYLFRLVFQIIQLMIFQNHTHMEMWTLNSALLLVTTYLSTSAIISLFYSVSWKEVRIPNFEILASMISIALAVLAFFTREYLLLVVIQASILLAGFIIGHLKAQKKHHSNIMALYMLIMLFWIFNLATLVPGWFMPVGLKVFLNVISIIVFISIYLRVRKWV